jgi:hypothetical protein
MVQYVSKTGVWDVSADDAQTPSLPIPVPAGALVKVTCQFFARTMTDQNDDGFLYSLLASDQAVSLTPLQGIVQGQDSWQMISHVALFEASGVGHETELEFGLQIERGGMHGRGSMMNFTLLAEIIPGDS